MSLSIESQRLWLQPMTVEEHFDDFWELWNDENVLLWSPQKVKTTREEAFEWMKETLPNDKNPNIDKFAILLRPIPENPEPWTNSSGKPKMIGLVGTNRMSDQGLETGYCINIKYWGKGYAGEAFTAFLKLYWSLPERMNFKQLVAKVDPGNVASQKIVTRVGAKKGEILKDCVFAAMNVSQRNEQQAPPLRGYYKTTMVEDTLRISSLENREQFLLKSHLFGSLSPDIVSENASTRPRRVPIARFGPKLMFDMLDSFKGVTDR
ncbi:hypothetical protein G7Y89_g4310 [Cudoniella acicularis]|uniref:N-acetyltransferase domain-containing protein n=1 Tax=Cudoniella acicularis TaxID=354080 RepID=A0A8H4RQK4_9HELO|nr:hypothetical protein G7Y89_g4310 [Cudoniella acicularis]